MTLDQLLQSPLPDFATLQTLWLAFPAGMQSELEAAQADAANHFARPALLSDGRLALSADTLSEIHPGGLLAAQFAQLDPANFAQVEVLDDAAFRALLPPSDEI